MHSYVTGYNFNKDSLSAKLKNVTSTSTTFHRIMEAIKFGHGIKSYLGDPAFADITEVCVETFQNIKQRRKRAENMVNNFYVFEEYIHHQENIKTTRFI